MIAIGYDDDKNVVIRIDNDAVTTIIALSPVIALRYAKQIRDISNHLIETQREEIPCKES